MSPQLSCPLLQVSPGSAWPGLPIPPLPGKLASAASLGLLYLLVVSLGRENLCLLNRGGTDFKWWCVTGIGTFVNLDDSPALAMGKSEWPQRTPVDATSMWEDNYFTCLCFLPEVMVLLLLLSSSWSWGHWTITGSHLRLTCSLTPAVD